MDISLQSLLFFIVVTIIYFIFPGLGKPALDISTLKDPVKLTDYHSRILKSLAFYIGIVIVSQFFLNIGYLIATCGGSINKNIGAAAIFTFIPWLLIFGIMVGVLLVFPGFKSAFSDVVGYFAVAGKANSVLTDILKGKDFDALIHSTTDENEKRKYTESADALMKILGNKSILINQISPDNFLDIWSMLAPLMKDGMANNTEKQQELLNLVVLKDNIGEAMWYVYTAILISSIVYYNLATRGCVKDVSQIKADHDAYIQQQEEAAQQQQLNNSTTYTV